MKFALIDFAFVISLFMISQVNNEFYYSANKKLNKENDSIALPIYNIDPCIFNILNNSLSKDSLCNYYRGGVTAYSFSIYKQSDFYVIEIRPIYLDRLKQINYFGAFKFNNRFFLCSGCKQDVLFSEETLDLLEIKLNECEDDYYLGGDVPSQKEIVTCKGLKFLFVITASCN